MLRVCGNHVMRLGTNKCSTAFVGDSCELKTTTLFFRSLVLIEMWFWNLRPSNFSKMIYLFIYLCCCCCCCSFFFFLEGTCLLHRVMVIIASCIVELISIPNSLGIILWVHIIIHIIEHQRAMLWIIFISTRLKSMCKKILLLPTWPKCCFNFKLLWACMFN